MTEVGRQPWVVYKVMRTEDAVTGASGVWVTFSLVLVLYTALGIATVLILRTMARRWREPRGSGRPRFRTDPARPRRRRSPAAREAGMSTADAVAGVLWVGATLYAVFGGADFGAGFWALIAGAASAASGRGP